MAKRMTERQAKNVNLTWREHEGEMNPPKLLNAEHLELMGLPPDALAGHPMKWWQLKVLDVWEEEWRKITGKDPRGSARHGPYIDYSQSDRPLVFDTPYENGQVIMTESTVVVSNPTATGPLGKDPGIVDKMISARSNALYPDAQSPSARQQTMSKDEVIERLKRRIAELENEKKNEETNDG